MKIKNDKGEEIEVFTAAEVEAKTKEVSESAAKQAIEEFKAANPDKTLEIETLNSKLKEAEEALKAAESDPDKKAQVERLRAEKDEIKNQLGNVVKNLEKKFEDLKSEMVGDTKAEYLNRLSGNDAELRKKIEFEFNRYDPNNNTKQGIADRMKKAYQLATDGKPSPDFLDGKTGGGRRGDDGGYTPPVKNTELNKNQIAIGSVLGINDEDRKNYETFQKGQEAKKAAGLIPRS